MTVNEPETFQRSPGLPEGQKWWHAPVMLAALFGAGAAGWALLVGAGYVLWLVRVYVVTAVVVLTVTTIVAGCLAVAAKGNWRAKAISAGVFVGLIAVVTWVWVR